MLEQKLNEESAKYKEWEENCWKVHEAHQLLKDKYEDSEGNIRSDIMDVCVELFLKSDACKNLYARLNYNAIRTVFKMAGDCIKGQMSDFKFLEEYQMYLDPKKEKDYVLPWNDSFESSRYFVEFPTPSPSDEEDDDDANEDEADAEDVNVEDGVGRNEASSEVNLPSSPKE